MLWLQYIQFLIFFICNPSITNPGPTCKVHQDKNSSGISVYYQNVQGLIPFGNLSDKHPNLDMNKISELHAYIYKHNPDDIILNETWLKPSISDSKILPANKYKLFRLDRSEDTHPVDQSNPLKYRRNGGGVLIAVNVSLSLESKVIPTKCAAEHLAVELILPNKSKVILATCYCVGTLGIPNCKEILEVLGKLSRKKMLLKFIVIGYFN